MQHGTPLTPDDAMHHSGGLLAAPPETSTNHIRRLLPGTFLCIYWICSAVECCCVTLLRSGGERCPVLGATPATPLGSLAVAEMLKP
jgi:hypothetical protein